MGLLDVSSKDGRRSEAPKRQVYREIVRADDAILLRPPRSSSLRLLRRPSYAVRFLRLLAANFPNLFTTDYADSADKKNGQDSDVAQELSEETETQHDTTGDQPPAERSAHLADPSLFSFFLCARAP